MNFPLPKCECCGLDVKATDRRDPAGRQKRHHPEVCLARLSVVVESLKKRIAALEES
jgi:hypothetical protein